MCSIRVRIWSRPAPALVVVALSICTITAIVCLGPDTVASGLPGSPRIPRTHSWGRRASTGSRSHISVVRGRDPRDARFTQGIVRVELVPHPLNRGPGVDHQQR